MARNGSGTYSLPAGNPVVSATTISSTWANNTLNDIATALTGSLAADGQTPVTANLSMNGFKLTGLAAGSGAGESVRYEQFASPPAIGTTTPAAGKFTTLESTGVATLNSIVTTTSLAVYGTATLGTLAATTLGGTLAAADNQVSRAMLIDQAYKVVDKGNINNATVTFDYTGGSLQTYTATGSTVTWATSNWPPTGNLGEMLIIGTNMGAYTHSISGITWIKPDGTTTTTLATYLAANAGRTAFQTSGVDQILLWSRDAGTTIYGKLI